MSLAPPTPPGTTVDWASLRAEFPWVDRMHGCPQDPGWHAEGDVGIHTQMVLQALVHDPSWQALDPVARRVTWLACLLHDVAKPDVTREVDGRITSRGHSVRGAGVARRLLWELGEPFAVREAVCALVRHHQVPFFLVDKDGAEGWAKRLSHTLRCDWLAVVTRADGVGRRCADQARLIDQVGLFEVLCAEASCLDTPGSFASDHARVLCGRDRDRAPDAPGWHQPRCTVTVTSGLPASGKSHYLDGSGLPVVSLDGWRKRLGIDPGDNQGRVLQAAREEARTHLRAGRDFGWSATNLPKRVRDGLIGLFLDYEARVELVYLEADPDTLRRRNGERDAPVPRKVIDRMITRWEVPTRLEAHRVRWYTASGPVVPAGLPEDPP